MITWALNLTSVNTPYFSANSTYGNTAYISCIGIQLDKDPLDRTHTVFASCMTSCVRSCLLTMLCIHIVFMHVLYMYAEQSSVLH